MKILIGIALVSLIGILYLWCKASDATRKAEPINGTYIKNGKTYFKTKRTIVDEGPDEHSPENIDVDSIHHRLKLRNQTDVDLDYSREDGK